MKFKRFVFGTDIHGDQQDKAANRVFFDFVKDFKPHIRVCGGDVFDFRPLRKKASEEERHESMIADFESGMAWLRQFKTTHFLRGNHCERLWDLAKEDRGVLSDFAYKGTQEIEAAMDKMGCHMLPYNSRLGVLRLGNLKMLHGYFAGETAARRMANVYGSCLFGHIHAIDEAAIARLERCVARACGCLCNLDMEYERSKPSKLRKAHGWAYGLLFENGKYVVAQAENIDGRWIVPTNFKEYK